MTDKLRTVKLQSLQAVRAVAALGVVLFHVAAVYRLLVPGAHPFGDLFLRGSHGVDLFFVLSGFVIALVHRGDIGRPARVWNYAFNRITRVYPAAIIVSAASLFLYLHGFGGAAGAAKLTAENYVTSFLLLPQLTSPLVNVTWTLKYEMAFYCVFALSILSRPVGFAAFAAWQAAVIWAACTGAFAPPTIANFYVQPLCLDFLLGIAGAMAYVKAASITAVEIRRLIIGVGIACAGVLVYLLEAPGLRAFEYQFAANALCYGLASMGIITAAALAERWGYWRVPALAVFLGDASYSIYLVHYSVIMVAAKFSGRRAGHVSVLEMLAVATVAVGAGVIFHFCVDTVVLRGIRRLRPGRRHSSMPIPAVSGEIAPVDSALRASEKSNVSRVAAD